MSDHAHYLPILVRADGITEWERKFCASLIAQQRRGAVFSAKQSETLDRIAESFKRRTMGPEGEVIE